MKDFHPTAVTAAVRAWPRVREAVLAPSKPASSASLAAPAAATAAATTCTTAAVDGEAGSGAATRWVGLEQLVARPQAANESELDDEQGEDDDDDKTVTAGLPLRPGEGRALAQQVVARRFIAARELNGLSQTEGARALGYAKSGQLSLIESGKKTPPLTIIVRAASAFGVSADYLLGVSDEPERDPSASLRSGLLRALRGQLDGVASALAGSFSAVAAVQHLADVDGFVAAVGKLLQAVALVEKSVGFDEIRGGASLLRHADNVSALHHELDTALQRHQEADALLRRQLAAARVHGGVGEEAA